MLSVKNLTKLFNNKKVLDTISFSVEKGSIAVFLGPSGVGKSTLLRVLNNLETPDAGTIELDGKQLDISTVNQTHTIGMVFQQFNLFDHLTIEQNITLSLKKTLGKSKQEAKKIAHELLEHYDLADKADKLPIQLSGGQKQRVALVRALALQPKIICLDEPTSALDPLLTTHVANTIQQLTREGYMVLVASHDTTLLEKLDCTIYLMDDGKIIETASSTDFKQNKKQYPNINQFVSGSLKQ